jgi:hypothetical protein
MVQKMAKRYIWSVSVWCRNWRNATFGAYLCGAETGEMLHLERICVVQKLAKCYIWSVSVWCRNWRNATFGAYLCGAETWMLWKIWSLNEK